MSHRSPGRPYDFLLKFLLVGDSDVGKGEILATLQDGASGESPPYGYNSGTEWLPLLCQSAPGQLWYRSISPPLSVTEERRKIGLM